MGLTLQFVDFYRIASIIYSIIYFYIQIPSDLLKKWKTKIEAIPFTTKFS